MWTNTIIRIIILMSLGIGLYYTLLYFSDLHKYKKLKRRRDQKRVSIHRAKRYGIIYGVFLGILLVIGFYCIKLYVWRMG